MSHLASFSSALLLRTNQGWSRQGFAWGHTGVWPHSALLLLRTPRLEQTGICSRSHRGLASEGARTVLLIAYPSLVSSGALVSLPLACPQPDGWHPHRCRKRGTCAAVLSPPSLSPSWPGRSIHSHPSVSSQCAGSHARREHRNQQGPSLPPGPPSLPGSCVEQFGPGSPASDGSVFSENRLDPDRPQVRERDPGSWPYLCCGATLLSSPVPAAWELVWNQECGFLIQALPLAFSVAFRKTLLPPEARVLSSGVCTAASRDSAGPRHHGGWWGWWGWWGLPG